MLTRYDLIGVMAGGSIASSLYLLGVPAGHLLAACFGVPMVLVMLAATFAPLFIDLSLYKDANR